MWVIAGETTPPFSMTFGLQPMVTWNAATTQAAFSKRVLQTGLVYNNKMWIIGGEISAYNPVTDVWSSSDGVHWTEATSNAAFPARYWHTSLVFNNKMWVIGGTQNQTSAFSDVWFSTDGTHWTEATANAAFGPRFGHTSIVYNNEMWVIGGNSGSGNLHDVWSGQPWCYLG